MPGYEDEVWFSRLAQPQLRTWAPHSPLRLFAKEADPKDPDPVALACYGVLRADNQQMLLRFVEGRPVSHVTTQFLQWLVESLAGESGSGGQEGSDATLG